MVGGGMEEGGGKLQQEIIARSQCQESFPPQWLPVDRQLKRNESSKVQGDVYGC